MIEPEKKPPPFSLTTQELVGTGIVLQLAYACAEKQVPGLWAGDLIGGAITGVMLASRLLRRMEAKAGEEGAIDAGVDETLRAWLRQMKPGGGGEVPS